MFTKSFLTTAAAFSALSLLLTPVLSAEDTSLDEMFADLPTAESFEDEAVNTGNFSFYGGFNAVSAYYSKGQKTEDKGAIIQPYTGINIKLFENKDADFIRSVGVYGEWWGSIQSEETDAVQSPKAFYESDYNVGLNIGLFKRLTVSAIYAFNTSPSAAWEEGHDFNLKLSYNDADFWEAAGVNIPGFSGLQPWFKVLIPLKEDAEQYFYAGIAPEFDIFQSKSFPVTFALPVEVGFGNGNWYNNGGGDFGYVDVGLDAKLPLTFIDKKYGNWTATAGIHGQYIGDAARVDDTFVPIAKVGLQFTY